MDRALVERAQSGDHEAYDVLARAAIRRLYLTAHRIVRDVDRADDAVQQALITIWRDLPSLQDPDRFEAWTYRVLVRHCLAASRRDKRRGIRWIPMDDATPAAFDTIADADRRDQLERALRDLSPDHRVVLVLHHYVGLPLTEIAEIVGVPDGTVRSRLFHASRALRAAIAADERTPMIGGQPA